MQDSKKSIMLLLSVAAALFIGATSLMLPAVYSSWWWTLFWLTISIGLIISIAASRLWCKPLQLSLHLSFLLMLAGGGATRLTAISGSLHLTPGTEVSSFRADDGSTRPLPCPLTLKQFKTDYYPGMTFPRDFRSTITAGSEVIEISMNHPASICGYRLCQTSFDNNGGSILSIRHDPLGTTLSFCGYALFAISGLILLIRRLRPTLWLAPLMLAPFAASAAPAVPQSQGCELEARQVVFRGRIVPFSTVAREFTLKLTGNSSVAGLSAERFLASIILYPAEWSRERFIYVKNASLRYALGMKSDYISPAELYADGVYRPEALYKGGDGLLDDAILRLDEKLALFAEACEGRLFSPLPSDSPDLRSSASIRAEILYNHLQPLRIYFILCLAGGIAIIVSGSRRSLKFRRLLTIVIALTATLIFLWQWWICGYIPVAGAAQTMQFLSMATAILTIFLCRRDTTLAAIGLLISGFTALVACLAFKDPVMTPLMPVLASPWLTIHVSIVMTAYAMLTFSLPASIAGLIKPSPRWLHLCRRLLLPGVYLLGLGIFSGAVWAEQSWGRYWAWDPKETWALVTMLLYAIPLHSSIVPPTRPRLFFSLLILAFASILMTYIGVNYLPSLHAYQ